MDKTQPVSSKNPPESRGTRTQSEQPKEKAKDTKPTQVTETSVQKPRRIKKEE